MAKGKTMRVGRGAALLLLALAAVSSGCAVRSISNAGSNGGRAPNPFYTGELAVTDVVGIDRRSNFDDATIASTLAEHRGVVCEGGSKLLLIQSGALIPDEDLRAAFARHFEVGVFSGVPLDGGADAGAAAGTSISSSLRMAAARSGHATIAVCWGMLESAREVLGSASVAWVPVVGWMVPSERERMRLRLLIALVDVRSGHWELFVPTPVESNELSSLLNRERKDQVLVQTLKQRGYQRAADEISAKFARP